MTRPRRIAVDVCIGAAGELVLREAGHRVVVIANSGESDRSWFARGIKAKADLFVAADSDLEILAYDANIEFFHVRGGERGLNAALRLLRRIGWPSAKAVQP